MTAKIKEILDIFTEYKDDWYSVEYILKPKQCVALYDYITNLQKENERLKLDVKYWKGKWGNTRFSNNQVKVLQDTIIKSANNTNRAIEQTEIYKSRCKKAIECIEKNQERKTYYGGICDGEDYYILYNSDEVLNILNGGDENDSNKKS